MNRFYRLAVFCLVLLGCEHTPPSGRVSSIALNPTRLVLIVIDQMRLDYLSRYPLTHLNALSEEGLSFSNAIVGHLSSNTIISHPVITSGLLPKHLPWPDDMFRNQNPAVGPINRLYTAYALSAEKQLALLKSTRSTSLVARLKAQRLGPVFTIGQKDYATYTYGGPFSDVIITLGEKRKDNSLFGWRAPVGVRVPPYISQPIGGRFYIDSRQDYGTSSMLYPLDGSRYIPGKDPAHLGGDIWTTDVALEVMKHEPNWRALFLTYGSVDKISHLLGEQDHPTNFLPAIENHFTLNDTLLRVDAQVGRIIEELKKQGSYEETLIVVTADHGGQRNHHFHGNEGPMKSYSNMSYGTGENFDLNLPPASLKPVLDTDLIEGSRHDTCLRFWLKKSDPATLARFSAQVRKLPGVIEIYAKHHTGSAIHYLRNYRTPSLDDKTMQWATTHHELLLESNASEESADIVALLADNHGYGMRGGHGGAQEAVQRIPLIIKSRNFTASHLQSDELVRLVDVNAMVSEIMDLPKAPQLDGKAHAIRSFLYQNR